MDALQHTTNSFADWPSFKYEVEEGSCAGDLFLAIPFPYLLARRLSLPRRARIAAEVIFRRRC